MNEVRRQILSGGINPSMLNIECNRPDEPAIGSLCDVTDTELSIQFGLGY